jgi:MinD superfamily P-loop ATPase
MRIAIASGKGGTGKTTVAVNLAWRLAERGEAVQYLDCEVEEPATLFAGVYALLRTGARLLVAEPRGRVTDEAFARTVHLAKTCGFSEVATPRIAGARAVLLSKG